MQGEMLAHTELGIPDNQSKEKSGPLHFSLSVLLALGPSFPTCCPGSGDHEHPTLCSSPRVLPHSEPHGHLPGLSPLMSHLPQTTWKEGIVHPNMNGLHSKAFFHPPGGDRCPGVEVIGSPVPHSSSFHNITQIMPRQLLSLRDWASVSVRTLTRASLLSWPRGHPWLSLNQTLS